MTDDQLITMLYESSPADLSAAQLKELRTRMLASSAVKRAVAHRVRLEQALTETMSPPPLRVAAIVAACTAAAVAAPLAGGLIGWLKGWGVTVWAGVAAATISVPLVVVVLTDPPPATTPGPAPAHLAVVPAPPVDVVIEEDSPSDRPPPGWQPNEALLKQDDPQNATPAAGPETQVSPGAGR